MKTPIEPKDIRRGDLIRKEYTQEQQKTMRAAEYVAERDGHYWIGMEASYYLLDRATPLVELPTEPTLGWAKFEGYTFLAEWDGVYANEVKGTIDAISIEGPDLAGFIPAVAVPTEALDALRADGNLDRFLRAVDEANAS